MIRLYFTPYHTSPLTIFYFETKIYNPSSFVCREPTFSLKLYRIHLLCFHPNSLVRPHKT